MNKNTYLGIIGAVGLYLITAGISYSAFSYFTGDNTEVTENTPVVPNLPVSELRETRIDESAPKTETCPLNNKLYTVAEKQIWQTRRPLSVMIENHLDSRPQSGLNNSDIVYEAVAEGGITRFMGVFYCDAAAADIQVGPVRSARTYFLDWVSEYGLSPLYAHVGGANCDPRTGSGCQNGAKADALGQIRRYGWENYNDMNQFSIGFPTFWRDYERLGRPVATEHTMYSTTDKLYDKAEERGLTHVDENEQSWDETYIPWSFVEQEDITKNENISPAYSFWSNQFENDYKVAWEYNEQENNYIRSNGGKPHIDLNINEPITAKNVVITFMRESKANDGYPNNLHLLYENKGKGKALVFINGTVIEANWSKKNRTSRTLFTDTLGNEIKFNPGRIWISVLPTGTDVDY